MSESMVRSQSAARIQQLRGVARVLVPLLLFLGALLTLAGGWQQLASYQLSIDPWMALLAFVVLLAAVIWASLVWTHMARLFGASLGWRLGVKVYTTSNLGKYLPGKVGHVVARVYLLQERGVPLVVGTTATVVDIVLYISAALSFGIMALPLLFPSYGRLATLAGLLCIVVGLLLLHPRVLNRVLGQLARRFPGGAAFRLDCGYSTVLALFGMYLVLLLLTTLGMLLSFRAVYPVRIDALPQMGATYGVAYIAGLVFPLAPNGVGVREGVMATLTSGAMPLAAAGAGSVLFRVLQVAAEALFALVARRF